ncbi:hypothetical protein [Bacillus toyonensis]|uniref:hypothetical protein n=1 Tax=Bacillus toyonensis TaxID=155322 RepID=UPI000BF567F9|nr:hypothetical protein [Bacillus toyonensis]PGF05151.1 hypothetical protein COM61_01635 [Bacillus toyonensis]
MTVKRNFKTDVFYELSQEVHNSNVRVVCFDENGQVVEIAKDSKTLKVLMQLPSTVGCVADHTSNGSVGFLFKSKRSVVGTNISPIKDMIDFAVEDLKNTVSNYNEFQKAVVSSNRFNHRFVELFSNYPSIEFELKSNYIMGDDAEFPLFKILYVYAGNLTLCITESQMTIMTECGNFVLHSSKLDADMTVISSIFSHQLGIDTARLKKALLG